MNHAPTAGEKLKILRIEADLSTREIAKLLGEPHGTYVSRENISKKEYLPMEFAKAVAPILAQHGIEPWRVFELAGVTEDLFSTPYTTPEELPEGHSMPVPSATLEVTGTVRAGVWGHAEQWPQGDDRREEVSVALQFPQYRKDTFLLRAVGESMNRSFPDGAYLVCVWSHAWDRAIGDGRIVIAERRHADGYHESTVKRLEIRKDGSHWLWPHSRSDDHQDPIRMPPPHRWPASLEEAEAAESVFVSAIVVSAHIPL